MAQIKVLIVHHSGLAKTPVELPDDVPMKRLIPALVSKMDLPITNPAGQQVSYKLDDERSGKRLEENDTLSGIGVQVEDRLKLIPEPTAGCFLAGTQIALNLERTVPIEALVIGNHVWSCLPETNFSGFGAITQCLVAETSEVLIVNGQLRVTRSHLVYANEGWKRAGELGVGDRLLGLQGQAVVVERLEWEKIAAPVYNLHLSANHTFFADGLLVHNLSAKTMYGEAETHAPPPRNLVEEIVVFPSTEDERPHQASGYRPNMTLTELRNLIKLLPSEDEGSQS